MRELTGACGFDWDDWMKGGFYIFYFIKFFLVTNVHGRDEIGLT